MLNVQSGSHARLRGETVEVRHVLRVPPSFDLFGGRLRAHYRAVCVWPDGRWDNAVDVRELQPATAPV